MRKVLLITALCALGLQGCGGAPVKADQDLSGLQLFGPQGKPRFSVDLACTAESTTDSEQCRTVWNAFYRWSDVRHVSLHRVQAGDPHFQSDPAAARPASDHSGQPYLIAILVEPRIVPTQHNSNAYSGNVSTTYIPGSAGYHATISVFSTDTGARIRRLPLRENTAMPDYADVTPRIKADMEALIAHVDAGYSP